MQESPLSSRAELVREISAPVESVAVFLYLIKGDCDDRFLVLRYAELAEQSIRRVMETLNCESLALSGETPPLVAYEVRR